MTPKVVFTRQARDDLERHYGFLLERDLNAAEKAIERIRRALSYLSDAPFQGRKVDSGSPFLRELVVSFGHTGFVALYEVESDERIVVLAIRAQREDDYS
ncbi:type II toxin-antitoxin system RelE/ParE family toxin [Aquisalimonas sp.]|uniref:type II toxin-antitoxin system RelE/ParE family toxin n=1 Tax=Aquisalimonas sp. TaxID=1872621 RepID=UPI0025BE7E1A|nr:type II toxin-antitoxin system RelE/ParE family toxin [Aquisalimonas sp.]